MTEPTTGGRRFVQVDVFGSVPLSGNPLAVVVDGDDLTTEQMQRITDWTNLSEATFLLPPTDPAADYRVRIFCPGRELAFAGHPTLGSCRAWLDAGGVPASPERVVQECGAGLVQIRRDGDQLAFAAPPLTRSGPVEPSLLDERLHQLGLGADDVVDAAWIDNGPGWMGLLLASADAVLAVRRPTSSIAGFDVGLVGFHDTENGTDSGATVEVRAFFADGTGSIREDPVTGSLNAGVARWLIDTGRIETPYVAAQGSVLGHAGRVEVDSADGQIWVGGRSTVVVDGTLRPL